MLGIAIFRTRTGPVWLAPALWARLLVEFVGSSISDGATYLSPLLLATAFFALLPQLREGTRPGLDWSDAIDEVPVRHQGLEPRTR